MQLPAVESRHPAERREHLRPRALSRAVVEDGHARSERRQRRRIGGVRPAVMRDQVHVHRSDEIARAGEIEQRGSCEIPDVEESKSAELDQHAGRPRILDRFLRGARGRPASRIGVAAARERLPDRRATGAHHDDVEPLQGNTLAGFWLEVPRRRAHGLVVLKQGQRARHILLRLGRHIAVIDERADRQPLREFHHAAKMIAVEMRDEEIVDPREPGLSRHGRNPDGIARAHGIARPRLKRAAPGKPRVDE